MLDRSHLSVEISLPNFFSNNDKPAVIRDASVATHKSNVNASFLDVHLSPLDENVDHLP
jgi:hypothetical protein